MYKLSAHQVKIIDELAHDKEANEKTLKVALAFHANRVNEIGKSERNLWDEFVKQFNLDTTKEYKTTVIDGIPQVVEIEKGQ